MTVAQGYSPLNTFKSNNNSHHIVTIPLGCVEAVGDNFARFAYHNAVARHIKVDICIRRYKHIVAYRHLADHHGVGTYPHSVAYSGAPSRLPRFSLPIVTPVAILQLRPIFAFVLIMIGPLCPIKNPSPISVFAGI